MPTQRDEDKRVTKTCYQASTCPQQFFNQTADFEHCEDRSELISRKLVAVFLNQTRSHARCVVIRNGPAPQTVTVATNRSFCDLSPIQQSLTVVAKHRWLKDLERSSYDMEQACIPPKKRMGA